MGVAFADTLALPTVVVWLAAALLMFLVLSSKGIDKRTRLD